MRIELRQSIYKMLQAPFCENLERGSQAHIVQIHKSSRDYLGLLQHHGLWPANLTELWSANDILDRLQEAFSDNGAQLTPLFAPDTLYPHRIQEAKAEVRNYNTRLCIQCMKNWPTIKPTGVRAGQHCPISHRQETWYWGIRAKDWERANLVWVCFTPSLSGFPAALSPQISNKHDRDSQALCGGGRWD